MPLSLPPNHTPKPTNRTHPNPTRVNAQKLAQEEALRDFPGCAVIISHDRWFLDRVTTHTLAFEETEGGSGGPSRVRIFPGNFSEYVAYRRTERRSSK